MSFRSTISGESREAVTARLILTREALGYSQAEWSRRTGIAPNTWNNYERGVARISLDEALKISRTVGVGLDWIYRGSVILLPTEIMQRIREIETPEDAPRTLTRA